MLPGAAAIAGRPWAAGRTPPVGADVDLTAEEELGSISLGVVEPGFLETTRTCTLGDDSNFGAWVASEEPLIAPLNCMA